MGSPLQKVLSGRRGKKGKALGLLAFFLLLSSYAGLLYGLPANRPVIWFPFVFSVLLIYSAVSFLKGRGIYRVPAFLAACLLVSGAADLTGMPEVRTAYVPLAVLAAASVGIGRLSAILISLAFLEAGRIFRGDPVEGFSIIGAAVAASLISHIFLSRGHRRTEALSSTIRTFRDGAIESLGTDGLMTQEAVMRERTDEEIAEVLETVKKTLAADGVHFFSVKEGFLVLRRSTEREQIEPSGEGLIQMCLNRRQPVSMGAGNWDYKTGYTRPSGAASVMAVPVLEGSFALGVLSADSQRVNAFGDEHIETLGLFARLLVRILNRVRIYSEIERSHQGLKVLHEESAGLMASLNVARLAQRITEGAYRIAPLKIVLLIKAERGYRAVKEIGLPSVEEKAFGIKNTLLEMAVKNRQHIYLSDLRDYSLPVLPFDAGAVGSAFMLPIFYERETVGILVLVSENRDSLTSYQIELLEVFGNQASTTLSNAKLHEKIEKMATTDGLTGLYNHRAFQEILGAELRRLDRFPRPLSLLLIDIDFFKKINDAFGHPAGDSVLRRVADIIRRTVREIDVPARYGGEEFAAVLVGTDPAGAKETAERLRTAIMKTDFRIEGKGIGVTVSIGVASVPSDALMKEGLVECADKALYKAKRSGRNMVVTWAETQTGQNGQNGEI